MFRYGEGEDQDQATVGADPESGGGGGGVLYEGTGEVQRPHQTAILCYYSPLRKAGVRDLVLRDKRLGVVVLQSLLLVGPGGVAAPEEEDSIAAQLLDQSSYQT